MHGEFSRAPCCIMSGLSDPLSKIHSECRFLLLFKPHHNKTLQRLQRKLESADERETPLRQSVLRPYAKHGMRHLLPVRIPGILHAEHELTEAQYLDFHNLPSKARQINRLRTDISAQGSITNRYGRTGAADRAGGTPQSRNGIRCHSGLDADHPPETFMATTMKTESTMNSMMDRTSRRT